MVVFCGCTSDNSTKQFNHVLLYTPWFTGDFGDGSQEWNGMNFDDELGENAIGLHPSTKSEFHFKVRRYPGLVTEFDNPTNFLHEIASETEAMYKITFTAERWENLTVERSFNQGVKYEATNFIFLCREGEFENSLPGAIYPVQGKIYFVHYLANVIHSDTQTNLSGTVFHAMAFIPETVDPKERIYLVSVMKLYIETMVLIGDPKILN